MKSHSCGILNHLAKKCRKHKISQTSSPQQTNVDQIESTPNKSDDEELENYIASYRNVYKQVYDSNKDNDSDTYVAAISSETAIKLEPFNAIVQFGRTAQSR